MISSALLCGRMARAAARRRLAAAGLRVDRWGWEGAQGDVLGLCKVRLTFRPIADFAGVAAAHQVTPTSPRRCVRCPRCTFRANTQNGCGTIGPGIQGGLRCHRGGSPRALPAADGMSAWLTTGPGSLDRFQIACSSLTAGTGHRNMPKLLRTARVLKSTLPTCLSPVQSGCRGCIP